MQQIMSNRNYGYGDLDLNDNSKIRNVLTKNSKCNQPKYRITRRYVQNGKMFQQKVVGLS